MTTTTTAPAATPQSETEPFTARLARAVCYLRTATTDADQPIRAQRIVCEDTATSLGTTIVEEFTDEGKSGTRTNRPELQRLLRFIQREPVAFVIVRDFARLGRSPLDHLTICAAIHQAGAQLVSASDSPNLVATDLTNTLLTVLLEARSSECSRPGPSQKPQHRPRPYASTAATQSDGPQRSRSPHKTSITKGGTP